MGLEGDMRKITIIFTGIFFVFCLFQVSLAAQNTPQEEKHIKILKLLVLEGYNKGDLAVVDKFVAAGFVSVVNGVTEEKKGPDTIKENITFNRESYDLNISILSAFCKGNQGALHWKYEGKHKQSGKKVSFTGVFLGDFKDGKLVKGYQHYDSQGLILQLGYTITPPDWAKKEK